MSKVNDVIQRIHREEELCRRREAREVLSERAMIRAVFRAECRRRGPAHVGHYATVVR